MSLLAAIRRRQPGRPLWRIAAWQAMQATAWLLLLAFYRGRCWGVRNIPAEGPVLFAANHQSFIDPVLLGFGASRRHFFSLGRASLYDQPWSAFMGRLTNSIPVEQGAGDVKAMKRCIEVLKQDQALMLFPEGARTPDGEVQTFETGTMLIVKRAKPAVIPVALDGPWDIWPRHRKWPRLTGRVGVMYGEPIPAETLTAMEPGAAMALIRQRVVEQREKITTMLR
ncbi:MAG: lysophospholipid acyltransferase family protein [Planctomycetota bacterium]